MIRKFEFWLDTLKSDYYEYNTDDFDDEEDLLLQVNEDRNDWVYSILNTGYIEIQSDTQCNNCNWTGFEEDLVMYNETSKVDNTTLKFFKGCPNCKTDEYLINI